MAETTFFSQRREEKRVRGGLMTAAAPHKEWRVRAELCSL